MDIFYMTSTALPRLCLGVLILALMVYFVLLSRKAPGTWWIVFAAGAFLVHNFAFFGLFTLHTSWSGSVLPQLSWSAGLTGTWAFLALAYRFLGNPYPRESRLILGITGVLVVAMIAVIHTGRVTWMAFFPLRPHTPYTATLMVPIALGTIVVYVRRAAGSLFSGTEGKDRPNLKKRAFVALAVLTVVTLATNLMLFLLTIGLVSDSLAQQILLLFWAIFIIGLITVYANFVPEQTSFQVKVVGFAFASMITVLGIASVIAFREPPPVPDSPVQALRFEPVMEGGYRILTDASLLEPVQDSPLTVRDALEERVSIGFAFPFAGTTWSNLFVDDDAYVSFGSRPIASRASIFTGTTTPWIAILMTDLAPTGKEVFLSREADRLTVTWKDVQVFSQSERITAQLVLEADGGIIFRYGEMQAKIPWFRGISPGPAEGRWELADSDFVPQNFSLVEDHLSAWFEADHRRSMPFALLILGAGVALLLVFPFYLHEGITRPLKRLLEGVRRTTEGDLDFDVDIGAQDEIGILTDNFNRMKNALRRSEASLRTYADELEKRVSERTAELDEKNVSLETTLHTLKTTQAQLIQSEKMASLGELTAGIAHEIKNPLNFVNNFAEVNEELSHELKEVLNANKGRRIEEVMEDLDEIASGLSINSKHIVKHGKRADSIVNSMMEHAHSEGENRYRVEVNRLVDENIGLSYHGMRAQYPDLDVGIEKLYDEAVGSVDMVPQEIGRVLINVLNNAFYVVHKKMQSAGGSYEPQVRVETRQLDNAVEIRIMDNGPGIPIDVKKRIFEPFFTTKPTGSGTGLGLSLAYDIVTQGHGGTMTVESEEGKGATFVITLPY